MCTRALSLFASLPDCTQNRTAVLLDPSTHRRAPLTHASHHRPALVHLSRFRASPILTNSRLRYLCTCVLAVSGVTLVGVCLLSADVVVVVLAALLDPSTHHRAPLTHASHHRPTLVHLSRFRVSPILTHSRFRRFSTFVSGVSCVSLVGVSLLSADVAVVVLAALLDPSTRRAPQTHASHHRPTLVHLSRFRFSPILTHSRFRWFSMCVLAVSGVSLVCVSLLKSP